MLQDDKMAGYAGIRAYFRSSMNALNYTEWEDAFNIDNIPDTLLSKANRIYHIASFSSSRADAYDMESLEVDQDIRISVFFKGYRSAATAIDNAMTAKDTILESVLASSSRLSTAGIQNIYFNNSQIIELDESNDNIAVLELNFLVRIVLCV